MRQSIVDFIQKRQGKTPISQAEILVGLEIPLSKYHGWVASYGIENRHNAQIPKQFWLQKVEREAILSYYEQHPDDGYSLLT